MKLGMKMLFVTHFGFCGLFPFACCSLLFAARRCSFLFLRYRISSISKPKQANAFIGCLFGFFLLVLVFVDVPI